MPDNCSALLKEGSTYYRALLKNDVFSSPRTMQALARRMATLDLDAQGPSQEARFQECGNKTKLENIAAILGIEEGLISVLLIFEPTFEPPMKKTRINASDLSSLPTSQRAINLLRRGCIPLFQPARREWLESHSISIKAGSTTITWPPTDWKDLSGDSKLLQWEVSAYKLCEATREPAAVVKMSRSELLDRFNFLALPGTACHHVPRAQKEAAKGRFTIYEQLRRIANDADKQEGDSRWLQILECGAMMRETTEDNILEQIEDIPLRLHESS